MSENQIFRFSGTKNLGKLKVNPNGFLEQLQFKDFFVLFWIIELNSRQCSFKREWRINYVVKTNRKWQKYTAVTQLIGLANSTVLQFSKKSERSKTVPRNNNYK